MEDRPEILQSDGGTRLAFRRLPGKGPEVVFLAGFRSDMEGTKAQFLARHCGERGQAFTRFDYRGHGLSSGVFEDGSIGDWLEDTLLVLDRVVQGRFVLVGSSMGGWLALLAARARPQRLAGLVGIAAAPDFTTRLIEPSLGPEARAELDRRGLLLMPSPYGD